MRMKNGPYIVDMHNHTHWSYDSSDAVEAVINNAISHGVDVIGITDHQFTIGSKLGDYFSEVEECKAKYSGQIKVLTAIEIGTRPQPGDLSAAACRNFDYVLFECLDDTRAMDLYEFLEWRRLFSCKVGLAHTDIFALDGRYNVNMLDIMKREHIFWELNTSGNYSYYYDFLTNEKKRKIIRNSGIEVSIGSDTHSVAEYKFESLKNANIMMQQLGNPLP